MTLEEILSPRNLAIVGGLAVFIGIAFLFSYAISNGWIDETVRTLFAAGFSLILVAIGLYAYEGRGFGAPAQALVVVGVGGIFLSLTAATRLYELIDPTTALILSGLIALFGALTGLRWREEAVAGSIVAAALISPLMIDAPYSTGLLAFLIPVFVVAVAASVFRPWMTSFVVSASLFLVSVVASLIDADGGNTVAAFALALLTLTLCVVGAVGHLLRERDVFDSKGSVIYGIFVSAATVLGVFLVSGTDLPIDGCANAVDIFNGCDARFSDVSGIWLIVAAAFGAGVWWVAREAGRIGLSVTAFAIGTAALAGGLSFLFEGGPALSAAWSAEAALLIFFAVTGWQRKVGYAVLAAAIVVAAAQVPFGLLETGSDELLRDLAILGPLLLPLAAIGWKEGGGAQGLGIELGVGVLAYMGMLTVGALTTPDHVLNLVPLVVAALVPACLLRNVGGMGGFTFFTSAAAFFALITWLPAEALVDGVPAVAEAIVAGGLLAALPVGIHLLGPERRRAPALWSALGLGLYLVSVLIIDGFQGESSFGAELPVTAQGQVIVSSLWALCGLGLIVAGLSRERPKWRNGGLILLILAVAKITVYDLSSLSTAGRMISFILVGLVLLAAAFAYQWMNRQEGDR